MDRKALIALIPVAAFIGVTLSDRALVPLARGQFGPDVVEFYVPDCAALPARTETLIILQGSDRNATLRDGRGDGRSIDFHVQAVFAVERYLSARQVDALFPAQARPGTRLGTIRRGAAFDTAEGVHYHRYTAVVF